MNKLLLVIDFINDITHPDGKIAASAAFIQQHQTIQNANKAIEWAEKNNVSVAYVKVGFSKNYLECPTHSPQFNKIKSMGLLQFNTWGTEFHADLKILPGAPVYLKHRVSAFYATALDALLTAQDIDTLILCGVSSNGTIQSTTRDAHDQDYKVIVLEDACADRSEEMHNYAMTVLANYAEIKKVRELE